MRLVDIPVGAKVYCPNHIDKNPTAFVLESQEGVKGIRCQSIACRKTYFLDTGKTRSFRYDFQYNWENARAAAHEDFERRMEIFEDETGIAHTPTCQQKTELGYGPDVLNKYPFHSDSHPGINPAIVTVCEQYISATSIALRYPQFTDDFRLDPVTGASMREALLQRQLTGAYRNDDLDYIVEEKAILNWLQHEGVTLIKSPKGSGKTKLMAEIAERYANYPGIPKRLLLIGHRRPLINATAERLEFISYLKSGDADGSQEDYNPPEDCYAVCLDSLPKLLKEAHKHPYDVIIIDEVEQVLSHLLSQTMKKNRLEVIEYLRHYLQSAKHIFLLDADLSTLSADIMKTFIDGDRARVKDAFYVINTYQPPLGTVNLYKSKNTLLGELDAAIGRGERCFVCANSKTLIESLSLELGNKFAGIQIMTITGENSGKKDSLHFINNIKEEILKYQVIAVSPSLGTGIDITFDDDIQHVDAVFGFFEARVNTHFDIDQQLSRVRDPKRINVWITHEPFSFETDANVIRQEIRELQEEFRTFKSIDLRGRRTFHEPSESQELYESIYAAVKQTRRASMNRLRDNFVDLRKANGWTIIEIGADDDLKAAGKKLKADATARHDQEQQDKILNARMISDSEYDQICRKPKDKRSEDEKNAMARYDIESFYNMFVTRELLAADDDWRLRRAIINYEILHTDDETLARRDAADRDRFVMDSKARRLRAKTLRALLGTAGYFVNGKLDESAVIHLSQLQPFIAACREHEKELAHLFEMKVKVRGDIDGKPTQQLGDLLRNVLILDHVKITKSLPNGGKSYTYQLDADRLAEFRRWYDQSQDDAKREVWRRERAGILLAQMAAKAAVASGPVQTMQDA